MGESWREAWSKALDELETEVTQVERLLVDDHRLRETPTRDPWVPPQGLGPLPLELRPRADAILSRQLAAAQAAALALGSNRQQAALASRIEAGRQASPMRPSYVDQAM